MSESPLDSFWKVMKIVVSLNKDRTPYTHILVTLESRLSYAQSSRSGADLSAGRLICVQVLCMVYHLLSFPDESRNIPGLQLAAL